MHTWFSTAWDDGAILPELLLTESLLAGSELSSGPAQSRVIIGFSILSWACFLKSVLDPGRSVLMHRVFANSWNREDLPISFLETDDFLNVKWNIELLNCAVLKCQEKPLFLQAELQCGLILCLWNNSRLQGKKLFFTTLKKKKSAVILSMEDSRRHRWPLSPAYNGEVFIFPGLFQGLSSCSLGFQETPRRASTLLLLASLPLSLQ